MDETRNISVGPQDAVTEKISGKSPQGFRQRAPKCALFSVTNTTRPFGHLSCTNFDHIWNNRRKSLCRSIYLWEISKFLHRAFLSSIKLPPETVFWVQSLLSEYSSNSNRVTVVTAFCQLLNKRICYIYVIWRQKSFWGLVDITRMCFLYTSFDGGCMVWALWSPEDVHFITKMQ